MYNRKLSTNKSVINSQYHFILFCIVNPVSVTVINRELSVLLYHDWIVFLGEYVFRLKADRTNACELVRICISILQSSLHAANCKWLRKKTSSHQQWSEIHFRQCYKFWALINHRQYWTIDHCLLINSDVFVCVCGTCQLLSDASCVLAKSLCRVANFCSSICSLCNASWRTQTG